MVTEVTEKRVTNQWDLNFEYDGKWVVYYDGDFPNEPDKGYVVAYGDGSKEDRDALRQYINEKYKGQALLAFAYVPKEDVVYGMYDAGIATEV